MISVNWEISLTKWQKCIFLLTWIFYRWNTKYWYISQQGGIYIVLNRIVIVLHILKTCITLISPQEIYFENLRIWSHLLKKPLMENFIFCAVLQFFYTIHLINLNNIVLFCGDRFKIQEGITVELFSTVSMFFLTLGISFENVLKYQYCSVLNFRGSNKMESGKNFSKFYEIGWGIRLGLFSYSNYY